MEVLHSTPRLSEYRKALSDSAEETTLNVFTTLDLSFEQLLKQDPAHVKSRCLTLFAFFDSTDVSELLMKTYCDRKRPVADSTDFGERLIAAAVADPATTNRSTWDSDAFVEILSALCQMSLVQSWSRDKSGLCHLILHPLVRDWIRLRTDLEASKNYSIAVADILSETIRSYEVTVGANAYEVPMKTRQQLLSQTMTYMENFHSLRTMLGPGSFRELYSRYYSAEIPISSFLRDSGHLDKAEEVGQHLVRWLEQEHGLEDVRSFAAVQNLTHVFSNQGKYSSAEGLARRVLPAKENILGPDHLDTLRTLTSLTINLEKQGKYVEAEGMLRQGLERKRRSLGPEHTSTIFSLGLLGVVLLAQARYVEAERTLLEALESGRRVYGSESSFVLGFTSNLAFTLAGQGRYRESEEMRRPLLLLQEKVSITLPLVFVDEICWSSA
jgi:tetratricopeptide (TPR) repeat protein